MNFSPLLKTMQAMIDNGFAAFETCIPAIIRKVNGKYVDVEPSIRACSNSGIIAKFDGFRILNVPLLRAGNNIVSIDVEPNEGDRVLLFFISRNTKQWKIDGWKNEPSNPKGLSRNDGNNCVALQISWDKAKNFIAVDKKGNVELKTEGKMDVSTDGDISLTSVKGKVKIKADVEIEGNLNVSKEVAAMTETPATKVTLSNHIHPTAVGPTSKPTAGI